MNNTHGSAIEPERTLAIKGQTRQVIAKWRVSASKDGSGVFFCLTRNANTGEYGTELRFMRMVKETGELAPSKNYYILLNHEQSTLVGQLMQDYLRYALPGMEVPK